MSTFAESHVSLKNRGVVIGKLMSTPASSAANASIQGVTVAVRITAGLSVAAGDTVLIVKHQQSWFVFAKVAAAPVVPPSFDATSPTPPASNRLPPLPKPTVRTGLLIVAPTQTATYRDGKWRPDVPGGTAAGDTLQGIYPGHGNNTGCAFYSTKPTSLAGATVLRAFIRVRRLDAGTSAARTTTLWLVTEPTRPLGPPTLTSNTAGPSLAIDHEDDSFDIPTAWAQAIVNGTAGGLAIFNSTGSPYVRLAGRSSWSPAWAMTIYWKK